MAKEITTNHPGSYSIEYNAGPFTADDNRIMRTTDSGYEVDVECIEDDGTGARYFFRTLRTVDLDRRRYVRIPLERIVRIEDR